MHPSAEQQLSDSIFVINKYYSDVFEKYNFTLKSKSTSEIVFDDKYFELYFGYEFRYSCMIFNGVGIKVKKSGKEYGLSTILGVLNSDSKFYFDKSYDSMSNIYMSGEQKCRIIWNDYIDATFKDPEPVWEKDIPEYLKRRYPSFHN